MTPSVSLIIDSVELADIRSIVIIGTITVVVSVVSLEISVVLPAIHIVSVEISGGLVVVLVVTVVVVLLVNVPLFVLSCSALLEGR